MKGVIISGIGRYFPKKIRLNSDFDISEIKDWVEKSGLEERRVADANETVFDLGFNAALSAIESSKVLLDEIGLIVFVSSTYVDTQISPTGVINLQQKLGLKNCVSIHVTEACNGALVAMDIAANFIIAGQIANALVVTSEIFSKKFNSDDELNFKLNIGMGDGAAAVVLSASEKNCKIGSYIRSSADFQGGLVVRIVNSLDNFRILFGVEILPEMNENLKNVILEIKKFTSFAIPEAINKVLSSTKLNKEEIKFYILHQPNKEFIEKWKEMAQINPNQTLDTLNKYGNLSSVSILVNLYEAYSLNKINKGDKIILASVGEGTSWGACIWEWAL